jgi:hypothetical protein
MMAAANGDCGQPRKFAEIEDLVVRLAGIASSPDGLWMNQIGRNLTDVVDGILKGKLLPHSRPRSVRSKPTFELLVSSSGAPFSSRRM